jgi:predicted membrane metal-binding protein
VHNRSMRTEARVASQFEIKRRRRAARPRSGQLARLLLWPQRTRFASYADGIPIKKWSAAAALAAAAFYLLLSGCDVATQRSFFMTAVVLIAVMVDRRAVTFRTLAVAAMIVLALAPEAVVHPSFQNLLA